MKRFTSNVLLVAASLLIGTTAANAQAIQFETNSLKSSNPNDVPDSPSLLYSTHRTIPFWADFNNDGLMDIYYSGTSGVHGWQTTANLIQNEGNMNFYNEFEKIMEEYTYQEDDGTGNMVDKVGYREVGMKSGLTKTAFGMGSVAIDYDQDGLVDFIFLNRGGNDTGTERELVLFHNLGNYKFEKIQDEALYNIGFDHDNNNSFNEDQEIGTISVGDYNKDGYPDIIVQGTGNGGRFVKLLRNKGGNGFELVHPVKPIAFEKEFNPIGLFVKGEDKYDDDQILIESGAYTNVPTGDFKPMSHGSVAFADFDNDGWLDIVATGYYDGATVGDTQYNGGDGIRFYRNLGDGTFQDVTDVVAEAAGQTLEGVQELWGTEDSGLAALDYNQDGKVDLFFTGSMRNRSTKVAIVLQNVSENGKFAFEEVNTPIIPTSGVTCRLFTVADFNGDDVPDFILRGWTSYEGINDWRYSINYSDNGSYKSDLFNISAPEEVNGHTIGGHFCETMSFGDFNDDGLLDAITSDWGDNGDFVAIHLNKTEAEVTAPNAPANVAVAAGDGAITVTWDAASLPVSGNEPMYNLYVKNTATNKIYTIVPALLESGKQASYVPFSSYVLSGGEDPTYTFCNLPEGNYEVGVQAVSYNYSASAFATATCNVTTAIKDVENATVTAKKEYYTVDGRRTNASAKGVVLVRQGNKVVKVVK